MTKLQLHSHSAVTTNHTRRTTPRATGTMLSVAKKLMKRIGVMNGGTMKPPTKPNGIWKQKKMSSEVLESAADQVENAYVGY